MVVEGGLGLLECDVDVGSVEVATEGFRGVEELELVTRAGTVVESLR